MKKATIKKPKTTVLTAHDAELAWTSLSTDVQIEVMQAGAFALEKACKAAKSDIDKVQHVCAMLDKMGREKAATALYAVLADMEDDASEKEHALDRMQPFLPPLPKTKKRKPQAEATQDDDGFPSDPYVSP